MNTILLIKQRYPTMSNVEKRIADTILSDPERAANSTIVYIAATAEVSEGSVSNFATSFGFKGFSQLKISLAQSISEYRESDEILDADTPKQILCKLIDRANASFRSTLDTLGSELDEAIDVLTEANRVIVIGVGHSKTVASDIAMRLMRLGLNATAEPDPLLAAIAIAQLGKNDCVIAVSGSGRTKDIISAASVARDVGAAVISLTSYNNSPLAEVSNIVLQTISMEAEVYREPTTVRLAQLMLCDCIVESLAHRMGEAAIINLDKMVEVYERYRESLRKDKRLN